MAEYQIKNIQERDYQAAAAIYNSNPHFLQTHLGMESIDAEFIRDEVQSMKMLGFQSCVITNTENQSIQGILDFKPGKEAYLSLLMLSSECQRHGVGRKIYTLFEQHIIQNGSLSIRIDVVTDYPDNIVPFWKRLGFVESCSVQLEWGNKTSPAVMMRKTLL